MIIRQSFLLPAYLIEVSQQKFAWGQWDCNTFISRWIDRLNNENSSAELVGKYSTALSAARYFKNGKPNSNYLNRLDRWCYRRVEGPLRTGDIVIKQTKMFPTGYIVLGNDIYSMDQKMNLIKTPIDSIDINNIEIWRL
jgi:hypothetical protein